MNNQLDTLISQHFPDVSVNKRLSRQIATGRSIPDFVTDWLVSRYTADGIVDKDKITQFLSTYLPEKKQKQEVLNDLVKGVRRKILDAYSVQVDYKRARLLLEIPCLDVSDASVPETIVEEHPLLLGGNVWGSGTLIHRPKEDHSREYEITMVDFKPMQTSKVDLQYFIGVRKHFTIREWRDLLIRSIGYNPDVFTVNEQMNLLTRLCPIIQPRINLIELAPKGTGKSYMFSQLSKYTWLISGGVITRAKLFYDMHRRVAGVITRYDAIVFDEVQTIRLQDEGEIIGALKGYLESGMFHVMQFKGSSDAGIVILANIPLTADLKPKSTDLMQGLPDWLQGPAASALLDRFHGLLPGWEIRKLDKECLCNAMALKADYLSEVMHDFRKRDEYPQFVKNHTRSSGYIRDINAVEGLAAAFLKLLFPDLNEVENKPDLFNEYCLEPAKALRARIREQLALYDQEYKPELAFIEMHI